jgi:2TM domain
MFDNDNLKDTPRYQPPTGYTPTAGQSSASRWPEPAAGQGWGMPPVNGWDTSAPGAWQQYAPSAYAPLAPDPQAEAYKRAARRVQAKLDFYRHLASYLIVNAALWIVAFMTTWGASSWTAKFWPIWITIFWGIGLASQAWQVFGPGEHMKERMIEEEMRKMQR